MAGKILARKGSIYIEDVSNACQAMGALYNTMTLSWTSEAPDVTGFGQIGVERLPNGIQDWTLSVGGFYSASAASGTETVLGALGPGGSTMIIFGPNGSSAGSTLYAASAMLQDYSIEYGVKDSANISATFVARTGSLTRGSWPYS